jgi:antirestriction protein ArdC
MKNNFRSKWWATFKQIKQQSGSVLKGSKATTVVLYRPVERTKINEAGKEVDDSFFVMRSFKVFNADQTTLEQFQVTDEPAEGVRFESYEQADQLIEDIGADIRYGGDEAFYNSKEDFIQLPYHGKFSSPLDFYEVCYHEHIHFTENESRLNWDRKNEGYAMGELIAELGSVLLMAELGLPVTDNLNNHAAYLKNWLKGMKNDPKFIFKASSQANKAVDWLLACSKQDAATEEPAVIL